MTPSESELVEELKRGQAAYNSGDFDGAARNLHPDFELFPSGDQPPIRGAKAVRAWMEPDAFASQVAELVQCTASGNKVLVRVRSRFLGSGSGIEMEVELWCVWTAGADGLWIRAEFYLDHEEVRARKAAGLPASGPAPD
jgi:ketosteroid isomerase-like protein